MARHSELAKVRALPVNFGKSYVPITKLSILLILLGFLYSIFICILLSISFLVIAAIKLNFTTVRSA